MAARLRWTRSSPVPRPGASDAGCPSDRSAGEEPAGFDRAAAAFPTRSVPLGRVVDLLHLSHRPDCVADYREAMRQGARFPPISVIRLGAYYLVADGHKRLQAYRGLAPDAAELLVECWPWRRWLQDQWAQFRRKQGQFASALGGGPGGGRAFLQLVRATLGHWWRVLRSLLSLAFHRRGADAGEEGRR